MRRPSEPEVGVYVEPWPSGGWAVKLVGHPVPVSRHDTEEEALAKADAYRRGSDQGQVRGQGGVPAAEGW